MPLLSLHLLQKGYPLKLLIVASTLVSLAASSLAVASPLVVQGSLQQVLKAFITTKRMQRRGLIFDLASDTSPTPLIPLCLSCNSKSGKVWRCLTYCAFSPTQRGQGYCNILNCTAPFTVPTHTLLSNTY